MIWNHDLNHSSILLSWFKSFVWRRSWFDLKSNFMWFWYENHFLIAWNHFKISLKTYRRKFWFCCQSAAVTWSYLLEILVFRTLKNTQHPPATNPHPSVTLAKCEFIHKSGKTVTCKKCDLHLILISRQKFDFDLKSVLGCDFDFKITFIVWFCFNLKSITEWSFHHDWY